MTSPENVKNEHTEYDENDSSVSVSSFRKNSPIKKVYPQRFREVWLSDPKLRPWLVRDPNNVSRAYCRFCKQALVANFVALQRHGVTTKHKAKVSLFHKAPDVKDEDEFPTGYSFNDEKVDLSSPINIESDGKLETVDHLNFDIGKDPANLKANPARIGFIGAGNITRALIHGVLTSGLVEPKNIITSAPTNNNLLQLKSLHIRLTNNNSLAVEESDMIFLCVNGSLLEDVISKLDPLTDDHNPLFMFVAPDITIASVEEWLQNVTTHPRVVKISTNTSSTVSQGICCFATGRNVEVADESVINCLLSALGHCEKVLETQLDVLYSLSCPGSACIYTVLEALIEAGVKNGIPRTLSRNVAANVVKGAASMVLQTGLHPAHLKDEGCPPGSPTSSSIFTMEKHGIRTAVASAIEASLSHLSKQRSPCSSDDKATYVTP